MNQNFIKIHCFKTYKIMTQTFYTKDFREVRFIFLIRCVVIKMNAI